MRATSSLTTWLRTHSPHTATNSTADRAAASVNRRRRARPMPGECIAPRPARGNMAGDEAMADLVVAVGDPRRLGDGLVLAAPPAAVVGLPSSRPRLLPPADPRIHSRSAETPGGVPKKTRMAK